MITHYAEILPLSSNRDDRDARSYNKGQNRILRPKLHIKSGIIHVWAEVAAILFFSLQNGGPLGGARLGARQKSNQYTIGDI